MLPSSRNGGTIEIWRDLPRFPAAIRGGRAGGDPVTEPGSNGAGSDGWVSLGRACRMLGVNESTLRRWADAGRIRSFRTPGGHRRFSAEDLRLLLAGRRQGGDGRYEGLRTLVADRIQRRLARSGGLPWNAHVDDQDARTHLRGLGRQLLALVTECLERQDRRPRRHQMARRIGREYGVALAGLGLPLHEAVEAYAFFRRSLEETAKQFAQRQNLSLEEAVAVWEQVAGLADEVLVALTEGYEAGRAAGAAPVSA